ncbi:hypothetical protein BKA83DRAFT_12169 [Pisolithus microcarpus]|nr:hypothetical protein BKA83DRAFT_12169 [Pisolithus microcarpus]
MSSSEPQVKLRAAWTQADVEMLLDYAEEIQYKAGNRMAFQEGHFNDLLASLPIQPNGLKREYYVASTIAGGLGLAYLMERGANVVTEAGQLVMDELIETRPEAAQFQNKGFKYWDRMQRFVPRDKARGANAHHAAGPRTFTQPFHTLSSSLPMSSGSQHPSSSVQHPYTTFVPYQTGSQAPYVPKAPPVSVVSPASLPVPTSPHISPSSIPISPLSSVMMSVDSSIKPSSSLSSCSKKHKSDTTGQLDSMSTATSGAQMSSSSRKRRTQVAILEDALQDLMASVDDNNDNTVALIAGDKERRFNKVCQMMYKLEKDLLPINLACLQMLFEEKESHIMGYKNAAAHSPEYRKVWVKIRLELAGYSVPEYAV